MALAIGIPLVLGSCWLALRGVRRVSAADAFRAGLLAMLAVGFKQTERSLIRKYQFIRTACGRYRIYHLNSVERIDVDVDCETPWRTVWGR